MNRVLTFAAAAEAATGLALVLVPALVGQLLLGEELTGISVPVARVAGITLIALGVACWPGEEVQRGLYGLLTYNLLVTLFFIYVGLGGTWVGILLWPAAAGHAVLTILLARAWLGERAQRCQ